MSVELVLSPLALTPLVFLSSTSQPVMRLTGNVILRIISVFCLVGFAVISVINNHYEELYYYATLIFGIALGSHILDIFGNRNGNSS